MARKDTSNRPLIRAEEALRGKEAADPQRKGEIVSHKRAQDQRTQETGQTQHD